MNAQHRPAGGETAPPRDQRGASHSESRKAPRRGQPGVRQCVVTRRRLPKDQLIRLVIDPEGHVGIDLLDRAPGRGIYVCADRVTVHKALSRKGIGKTFRGRAKPMSPGEVDSLIDEAVARLDRRIVELVTVARRAQVTALGMDPVLSALIDDTPAPVITYTADVSERSLRRVRSQAPPATAFVGLTISKSDFGSKLGRKDVGVVAIRPSALATRIVAEAVRRDGLGALPQPRPREEGLTRDDGEPSGGRSN